MIACSCTKDSQTEKERRQDKEDGTDNRAKLG